MYKRLGGLVAIFFILFATASAAVVVRTADQLEIVEDVIDGGELLAVGLPVTLSNEVVEDAVLIGNRVKVKASVGEDLLALGFFVDIDAPVSDDVRVIGGEVTIASEITGDLLVLGGTVELLSTASVGGDIVMYGGSLDLSGDVVGNVLGAMESLTIKGAVGGGVDVRTAQLILGETASIKESVRYVSGTIVNQALNATVGGDIVRNDPIVKAETSIARRVVLPFLIGLFSTLVWYLFSRKTLAVVTNHTTRHIFRSAVVGTAVVFLAPFAIAILFVSQLGAYVAAVCLVGLVAVILLGGAAAPAVAGKIILQTLGQPTVVSPLSIALGALLLAACLFIPVIGVVLLFSTILLTVGGIIESAIKASR